VASYRDEFNSEAVHFPGDMLPRILIVVGLVVCFSTGMLSLSFSGSAEAVARDAAVLVAAALLMVCGWPREILVDQNGVHQQGLLWIRKHGLSWKRVDRAYFGRDLGAPLGALLGLRTSTLVIEGTGSSGSRVRIVLTPRHSDSERLLRILRMNGVKPEAT
jgi:hypothetical protein